MKAAAVKKRGEIDISVKAPFMKEAGEDPFLEGRGKGFRKGRAPQRETAHAKREK